MVALLLALSLLGAWTESFEAQDYFPPNDWLVVNKDVLDGWWYRTALDGNTGSHSAACWAEYATYRVPNQDWLITPRVLPQSADTLLGFACRTSGTGPCTLDVMTAPRCSMPAFEVLQTLAVAEPTWSTHALSLAAHSGTPIYIAFRVRYIPPDGRVWIDDVTLPDLSGQPQLCNGRLRVKALEAETTSVQQYLQAWGSHSEMGFAQGFLLAEEVMAIFIRWFIGTSSDHIIWPSTWENYILPYFRSRFSVPQKYQDETQGLYDGIRAKGVSIYHPALARDLTVEDLLCFQAFFDFGGTGCSSVSGWGESTIQDDTLQGGTVFARNADFENGPKSIGGNTSLVIAYSPGVPGEQPLVSLSIAGWIGVRQGLNASGLGACYHASNVRDTGNIAPGSLVDATLSLRHALEAEDPDGSGISDVFDVATTIPCSTVRNPLASHVFSPFDSLRPTPVGVWEANNVRDSLRLVSDNGVSPDPINSDWNLALTNHYRVLYAPEACGRYYRLAESLNADIHLSTERTVRLVRAANQGSSTQQNMVFRPNVAVEHRGWPFLGASYIWRGIPAYRRDLIWYTWDELFQDVPGVAETPKSVTRTPNTGSTIVRGVLRVSGGQRATLVDISGRDVLQLAPGSNHLRRLAPGIYFVRTGASAVQKFIVAR